MDRCHLLYIILNVHDIDVASIISDCIRLFVYSAVVSPSYHPSPEGTLRNTAFLLRKRESGYQEPAEPEDQPGPAATPAPYPKVDIQLMERLRLMRIDLHHLQQQQTSIHQG
ncbi:membrane protein [Sesbania bispinosa]|nr:membrane protein [Sesbania bispinosa]